MDLLLDSSLSSVYYCCRTCLTTNSALLNIFEGSNINNITTADILMSCTSVNVSKNDSLPKSICQDCYDKLNSFYEFRISVEKNDTKFREVTEEKPNLLSGCNINENKKLEEIKIENGISGSSQTVNVKEENVEADIRVSDTENKLFVFIDNTNIKIESKDADSKTQNNDKKYVCNICNKKFRNLCNYQSHIKKHLNNNTKTLTDMSCEKVIIKCAVCASVFESSSSLLSHMSIHRDDRNFTGKVNYESQNTNECLETKKASNDDFKCEVCKGQFRNKYSLSAHMRIHAQKGRILACSICGKVFNKISHLKRHEFSHEDKCYESQNTNESLETEKASNDDFKCKVCKRQFRNKYSLSAHMRKHAQKGRILACSICGKVFNKISHLKRHEFSHEDKCPFKCRMCQKSYPTQEMLQEHTKHHNEVKPHVCPVCQNAFFNMPALNTHIKIHTRDKLYIYPTCGKQFDSSTNLNQHVRRHTGIKAFACPLCPKKFVSKDELKFHGITHIGEKSYKCQKCNASFTKHSSLVQHNLRHLGVKPHHCDTFPMKCNECTESFRLKSELRAHVSHHYITHARTHAPEQGGGANVDKGDMTITNHLTDHLHSNKE